MCISEGTDRLVIPPAAAFEITAQADKIYVRDCICRAREQRCPPDTWEVCLLFEPAAPEDLQQARPITANEALAILKRMVERRAIYQLFYTKTSHEITELCSCCTCCCSPLNRIRREGGYADELRSGYMAVTDITTCDNCGLCLEDCFFGAREIAGGTLHLIEARCFGCGRCIAGCPQDAIRLERVGGRRLPIQADV